MDMRRALGTWVGLGLILSCGSGCHHGGGAASKLLAEGIVTGLEVAAVAAASSHAESSASDPDPDPPVYTTSSGPVMAAPPFDLVAARAALRDTDIASCLPPAEVGAPIWAHASVTFGPRGNAIAAVVDDPHALSGDALHCIGARLGNAEIPEFDGNPVTVGFSFRVR